MLAMNHVINWRGVACLTSDTHEGENVVRYPYHRAVLVTCKKTSLFDATLQNIGRTAPDWPLMWITQWMKNIQKLFSGFGERQK